jgi:hypothetical protein
LAIATAHALSPQFAPLTDAGLKELRSLKCLQSLFLNGIKVTDAGINDLRNVLLSLNVSP